MTNRERFIKAISFERVDRPARMDMFCLIEEALGKPFPSEEQLENSKGRQRTQLIQICAEMYAQIADRYDHDCIFVWHPFEGQTNLEIISALRKIVGHDKAILGLVMNAVWGLEQIEDHMRFATRMADDMNGLHAEARTFCDRAIQCVQLLGEAGADVAYVPDDVAFNSGPYFPPQVYEELILPYAQEIFAEIHRLGMIGIYHTDGNVMKLLDMIMTTGAHALQSIDPMAGMDIGKVKALTRNRLALVGNVQCSLLQHGSEEDIRASARTCLTQASPGSGYVFMASNSIFSGIPLENYHAMQAEYEQFVTEQNTKDQRVP